MASTIIIKNGTGSAVPSSLTQGELAINVDNGALFYGTSGSSNAVSSSFIFTELSASNIVTHLNITASGNISASGDIIAENITATDITVNDDLTVNDNIVLANNSRIVSSNESNTYIELQNDDGFNIRANNVEIFSIFSSGVVVNDDGLASADFRIESDSDTHAFFVDSGADKVAIGTGTVGNSLLTIDGDVTTTSVTASNTVSASAIHANQLIGDTALGTGLLVTGEISGSQISSSGNISATGTITGNSIVGTVGTATQGTIDHDSLANFVANEHIDHTSVTLTAGSGLSGGGDISANRSLAVATTQTHITSITNTGLKVGRATDDTYIDFGTDDKIQLKPANSIALEVETTGIDVTGEITASGNINGGSITTTGDISTDGILFTDDIRRLTDNSTSTRIQMAGNNINIYAGNASNSVLQLVSNAGAVFNNGGVSSFDFRVEGDNDTHLLFADAGADKVAIGTDTVSDSLLTVDGDIKTTHITASGNINATGNVNVTGSVSASNFVGAPIQIVTHAWYSNATGIFPNGDLSHLINGNNNFGWADRAWNDSVTKSELSDNQMNGTNDHNKGVPIQHNVTDIQLTGFMRASNSSNRTEMNYYLYKGTPTKGGSGPTVTFLASASSAAANTTVFEDIYITGSTGLQADAGDHIYVFANTDGGAGNIRGMYTVTAKIRE